VAADHSPSCRGCLVCASDGEAAVCAADGSTGSDSGCVAIVPADYLDRASALSRRQHRVSFEHEHLVPATREIVPGAKHKEASVRGTCAFAQPKEAGVQQERTSVADASTAT
jgi:hypothetical protein